MAEKTAYQMYVEKFGEAFDAFKKMPYQISPTAVYYPGCLEDNPRLDKLYRYSVKVGHPFTVRKAVDCLYREDDGFYVFNDFIKTRDYNDFMRKAKSLHIVY